MSKVWLITGASRGLGRSFTQEALKAGHRVVAAARNVERLAEVASKFGESVRTVPLDVTNEAQAKNAVEAAIETFGCVDVLVNNAGYGNVYPVEDTSLADFRAQIETNLFGVIIMTKAVLPHFRERGAGHIIQISSIGGRVGPVGRAAYAAAKFGVECFSESLSKEVGPLGIKVTIVEPGGFRTDLDRVGNNLMSGGDTEFGSRLLKAGERLRYEPSAVVYHPVTKDRMQKRYFLRWRFDKGRGNIRQYGVKSNTKNYFYGIPLYLFRGVSVWTLRWMVAVDPSSRFESKLKVWGISGQIAECYRQSLDANEARKACDGSRRRTQYRASRGYWLSAAIPASLADCGFEEPACHLGGDCRATKFPLIIIRLGKRACRHA